LTAWFPSITNYDLALIRWAFETTGALAGELAVSDGPAAVLRMRRSHRSAEAAHVEKRPLPSLHRHFSHLMAIHRCSIRWENGPADQAIIKASLADLEAKGTAAWCGYSFSWLANLAARARDGEKAERALQIFSEAFCLRNGFHCNGDQSGKGYSNFRYRPFTLEGNFAAAAGLQEMLLQSFWQDHPRLPAIPTSWKDVLQDAAPKGPSPPPSDGMVPQRSVGGERGSAALESLRWSFPGMPSNVGGKDLIMDTSPDRRSSSLCRAIA
jgi:alpha-L-fucosidase 2